MQWDSVSRLGFVAGLLALVGCSSSAPTASVPNPVNPDLGLEANEEPTALVFPDPGETAATAFDFDLLSANVEFLQDNVSRFDTQDYYRFIAPNTSELNLIASISRAPFAGLELLDANETPIVTVANDGSITDGPDLATTVNDGFRRTIQIQGSIAPGTYFIRVFSNNSIRHFYSLTASLEVEPGFTVNDFNDGVDTDPGDGLCFTVAGTCSLRAAVMEANAFPDATMITVPAGSYPLTQTGADEDGSVTGDLDIRTPITIMGSGTPTIDGNGSDRVFDVLSNGSLTLQNVSVVNGSATTDGGGLRNAGSLTLTSVSVQTNSANGDGGGLFNSGTATLENGTAITQNTSASEGGGVYNAASGLLNINGTAVVGPSNVATENGGGLFNEGVVAVDGTPIGMTSSQVTGNTPNDIVTTELSLTVNSTADGADANPGDGVCATSTSLCTLRAAVMEANALGGSFTFDLGPGTYSLTIPGADTDAAQGDLDIRADITITGSTNIFSPTVIDATGANDRAFEIFQDGFLSLSDISITGGNSGDLGGAIFNANTLRATNLILRNNSGTQGGGLFNDRNALAEIDGYVIIDNNTGNGSGGGVFNGENATLTLQVTDTLFNSSIDENVASLGGGVFNAGTLTISGLTINSNTADTGGGLYNTFETLGGPAGTSTLSNVNINGNVSDAEGGGVYLNAGAVALSGGSTASSNDSGDGGGLFVLNGSLTFNDGEVDNNDATRRGAGIFARNGSVTLTNTNVTNGEIRNFQNDITGEGGGVYVADGTLTISGDSEIRSNRSETGAGITAIRSPVTINDTTEVRNNTSQDHGGGVFLDNGSITLNGSSRIASNQALGNGGGLFSIDSIITLNNSSEIDANQALEGGGLFSQLESLTNGTTVVTLRDTSQIQSNRATVGNGGGILTVNGSVALASGSRIISNRAQLDGGGLAIEAGTITVTSGVIDDNTASRNGGGIANLGATLTVTGSQISANTANGQGGGLFSDLGQVTVTGATVSSNRADANGGGLANVGPFTSLTLNNTNVQSNTAQDEGGGLYNVQGLIAVNTSTVTGNQAISRGGGIRNTQANLVIEGSTLSSNTVASPFFLGSSYGGGLSHNGPTLTVTSSDLASNISSGSSGGGGGLHLESGSAGFNDVDITSNTAESGSGFFLQSSTALSLTNGSVVTGNIALNSGGGGFLAPGSTLNICTAIIDDNFRQGLPPVEDNLAGSGSVICPENVGPTD